MWVLGTELKFSMLVWQALYAPLALFLIKYPNVYFAIKVAEMQEVEWENSR